MGAEFFHVDRRTYNTNLIFFFTILLTCLLCKNRKSFDENLIIFQYMGSIMCRKICSEFARPAQMVKFGISIIFYEVREVETQQKRGI